MKTVAGTRIGITLTDFRIGCSIISDGFLMVNIEHPVIIVDDVGQRRCRDIVIGRVAVRRMSQACLSSGLAPVHGSCPANFMHFCWCDDVETAVQLVHDSCVHTGYKLIK